jgi:hypothetical protein
MIRSPWIGPASPTVMARVGEDGLLEKDTTKAVCGQGSERVHQQHRFYSAVGHVSYVTQVAAPGSPDVRHVRHNARAPQPTIGVLPCT